MRERDFFAASPMRCQVAAISRSEDRVNEVVSWPPQTPSSHIL